MASKRPGYARSNTERAEEDRGIELGGPSNGESSKNPSGYEFRDPDTKAGAVFEVQESPDDSPPGYEDAGDGFAKVTEPVETAKDLVTQVLHVEDDPTLSPYTFRVFFLGRSHHLTL